MKLVCSLPDGYEARFFRGSILAGAPGKPPLRWNGDAWVEIKPWVPTGPLLGNDIESIIIDDPF